MTGAASKAKPTPEAETGKARTARGAPTAKGPASQLTDSKQTPSSLKGPRQKKAAPAAAKKTTGSGTASRKAAPAAGKKTTGSGAASKKAAPSRRKAEAAPLAPEALPRVRRTLDRPASSRQRPAAAPRDRSALQEPGLRELDWQHMAEAARSLAGQVGRTWSPDIVVGVAKGGVFAGQEVASALRLDFFPVRVGKRSRDVGARAPEAAASMPAAAAGRRVLVVDDIAGSGATLRAAIEAATKAGAAEVRTATLVVKAGGYRPDFAGLETADLVVFPWDYEPSPGAVGSAAADDDEEESGADEEPAFVDDDEDDIDGFGV